MTIYQVNVGMKMIKYQEYLGQNVTQEVLDLMEAIKRKNPMLGFTVGGNKTSFFDEAVPPNRVEVKMSLIVHEVSDPKTDLGSIGCDHDDKYWVRSRLISNEKFSHWNSAEHQSKKSKHIKNIIKEAVKYLKPFSFKEKKAENEGDMDRQIHNKSSQMQSRVNNKMRIDFTTAFPELLHMHNIGYVPATPKMAEAISWAVENKEEIEKYYEYKPKKCMIWVRPNNVVYEIDGVVTQVNSTADLPEDLRGKLFVLDVTDKGQFIEDVGMKQETGIYWVLLEEK